MCHAKPLPFAQSARHYQVPLRDELGRPVLSTVDTARLPREVPVEGRRMVVAHDPAAAAEQTARRRAKLKELVSLGDALAAKLDAQDAGQPSHGRRASDRGAYTRFQGTVLEAGFSRFLHADLRAERFRFSVEEAAPERAELLDGKLVLLTNVTDLPSEEWSPATRRSPISSRLSGARARHRDRADLPPAAGSNSRTCHDPLPGAAGLPGARLHAGPLGLSVERTLESLRSIQYHRVAVDGRTLSGITRMSPEQRSPFDQLEVNRPQEAAL